MTLQKKYQKRKKMDFVTSELDFDHIKENSVSYGAINIFEDRLGRKVGVPTITISGEVQKPIFGIVAAVHGNEINGIPTIHELVKELRDKDIYGTIVAVPIANVPGYLMYQREFIDGIDLNRIFPGKQVGTPSQEYAYHFLNGIIKKFDYLIDLHTASFGRVNSHYIRADITNPEVNRMLSQLFADIIVHTTGPRGTLRHAAMQNEIPSITMELGNPQYFQKDVALDAMKGIKNILSLLKIIDDKIESPTKKPYICESSKWYRCHDGGILTVYPKLVDIIKKDEVIARLVDIYGRKDIDFFSDDKGIVIGKNINPVVSTGDRILHLGKVSKNQDIKEFQIE